MSDTVTTKRYYTMGGTVVAVRDSGTGAVNYLLGDQLGSTTTSVNASTGATSTQRFLPYGAPRSGSITATDRGWIGQTKDASTGLQYLNARYYDPTIGRLTATDPLADLQRPASLDAFGYGHDSSVSLSDPTGMLVPVGSGGKGDYTYGAVYAPSGGTAGGNPSGAPPPLPIGPPAPEPPSKPDLPTILEYNIGDTGNAMFRLGGTGDNWQCCWYREPAGEVDNLWFAWLLALAETGTKYTGEQRAYWVANGYFFEARVDVIIHDTKVQLITDPSAGAGSISQIGPRVAAAVDASVIARV